MLIGTFGELKLRLNLRRTCDGNHIIDLNQEYHTILLITNAVPRSHRGVYTARLEHRGINLN
jgi:hypothetical protein